MNSKFFFTLVGLFIAVFAICNLNLSTTTTTEPFIMNAMTPVNRPFARFSNGQEVSLGTTMIGPLTDNQFVSVADKQKILSPRFMSPYGQMAASVSYNLPDSTNMAGPSSCSNDTFSQMVTKEDFCSSGKNSCGSPPSCMKGGLSPSLQDTSPSVPANFASGNFTEMRAQAIQDNSTTLVNTSASLPVSNMMSVGADGQEVEPVIYNTLMYANQKSYLRSQGDYIRGDLPIVPCNNGWFNVSVVPAVDLNAGALNVMGGVNNGLSKATANVIFASSGNANTTSGGVDTASVNMANQVDVSLDAQSLGSVVNAVAFA